MKRKVLFLCSVLLGCGPQVSTGSGGDGEGNGAEAEAGPVDDGPDVPSEDPDMGVPNPCSEGELLCGEECIDPMSNDEHCGRCDNECERAVNVGGCEAGVCPPNFECGGARTDYEDCNAVCEGLGTSCVDGLGCSGSYDLYYGLQGVDLCEAGVSGGFSDPEASCSTPIDWSFRGGLEFDFPVAVSCCCLQE